MIVKNESKIIERLLASVLSIVDTYCICDTGSTDNTPNVIREFMKKHNKPGIVIIEPFKIFGYNRSFALDKAAEWG
jgi:glycosyltransferase involved in cell wall biosynthesis